LNEPSLTLPHPRLSGRRFVLTPFAEIAPRYRVPALQQTVTQLSAQCPDDQRVVLYLSSLEFRKRIQTI